MKEKRWKISLIIKKASWRISEFWKTRDPAQKIQG
jgi:hypothetical protein